MLPQPQGAGRQCRLLTVLVYGTLLCAPARGDELGALPPPPRINASDPQQQYMLALVINGSHDQPIVPVQIRQGHYRLRSQDLRSAGLPADKLGAEWIDVSAMAGVQAEYDARRQQLLLSVPADWLPVQAFNNLGQAARFPGRTSNGAVLNYDIYTSRYANDSVHTSAWHELRWFGEAGHLSTDGMVQRQLSGQRANGPAYVRYDSYWSNEDETRSLNWTVGDVITNTVNWGSSVRIGGIQLSRDFSVRPDIITYPLPAFNGQAAVPSTIDMFINGYKTSSNDVQAGPFSLTNLPYVNGAGDAIIVTTDATGRQITTSLPFYVSSSLLKPGLSDFSVAGGALRQGYGVRSFDYGAAVMSGSYRQGISDWLTLESHAEGADALALAGVGSVIKLGSFGILNNALSHSQLYGRQGSQADWGYQYNTNRFSLGTQHTLRSAHFGNLAIYDTHGDRQMRQSLWSLSRRSAQYNASVSLNRYGNLGAAYIEVLNPHAGRTRLWNLSWSKNLWGDTSLFIAAGYNNQQQDWSGAVSLIIPFGQLSNLGVSTEHSPSGGLAERLTLSRAMPSDGGFKGDFSYARQARQGDYSQGSLGWRNDYLEVDTGFYGYGSQYSQWNEISGAFALMDGQWMAANQLNNSFVLVKTGYPDVEVSYENQPAGRTNRAGYLLVPGVTAYYPGKYDINTLDLPASMNAASVEQRFAVRRQSGYLLDFPVTPLRAASVILHDAKDLPLPVSSEILRAGQPPAYVGWDGLTWLDKLTANNIITVVTPDGGRCQAQLILPGGKVKGLETYGPIRCMPIGSANGAHHD